MPAEKIAQGVPLYGRCWTLSSADNTGYYAPATQPGMAGPYTRSPGFLGYNEVRDAKDLRAEGYAGLLRMMNSEL